MTDRPRAPDVLDRIMDGKRAARARRASSLGDLRRAAAAAPPPRDARAALRAPGRIAVIAEFKRRSPSAGWLQQGADAAAICAGYARAGARALSVLTDEADFGAAPGDLEAVCAAVPLPALRKDFLLDEYDLCAARAAGASLALLIARVFPDRGELAELIAAAAGLGLAVLVEAHSLEEAERSLAAGADIIGVNHRDLQTLRMDLSLSDGLRARLGPAPILVAESGLRSGADLRLMRERGMDAALIGEMLLREPDPPARLRRLLTEAGETDASAGEGAP